MNPYREPSPRLVHWDDPEVGDDVRHIGDRAVGTVIKRGELTSELLYVWVDFWGYWAWPEELMVVNRPAKEAA